MSWQMEVFYFIFLLYYAKKEDFLSFWLGYANKNDLLD